MLFCRKTMAKAICYQDMTRSCRLGCASGKRRRVVGGIGIAVIFQIPACESLTSQSYRVVGGGSRDEKQEIPQCESEGCMTRLKVEIGRPQRLGDAHERAIGSWGLVAVVIRHQGARVTRVSF